MSSNKCVIRIDEQGPRVESNGVTIASDLKLTLKDYIPAVTNWTTWNGVLNKGDDVAISTPYKFIAVRARNLGTTTGSSINPTNGSMDLSSTCLPTNNSLSTNCGCGSDAEESTEVLLDFEMEQYTNYVLSEKVIYSDNDLVFDCSHGVTASGVTGWTGCVLGSTGNCGMTGATGETVYSLFPGFVDSLPTPGGMFFSPIDALDLEIGDLLFIDNPDTLLSGQVEITDKDTGTGIQTTVAVKWLNTNTNNTISWDETTPVIKPLQHVPIGITGELGATCVIGTTGLEEIVPTKGVYTYIFTGVLEDNNIVIKTYEAECEYKCKLDYYAYAKNDNDNILYIFDNTNGKWVFIRLNEKINDIVENKMTFNIIELIEWSESNYTYETSNITMPSIIGYTGTNKYEGSIVELNENMPVIFKINSLFIMEYSTFKGKISAAVNNLDVSIMLAV